MTSNLFGPPPSNLVRLNTRPVRPDASPESDRVGTVCELPWQVCGWTWLDTELPGLPM